MSWIALVGPELEENLSLRYLASSLATAGYQSEIVAFNQEADFSSVMASILTEDPPLLVGISLAFQWRAQDGLALAVALRERGYRGHITMGGHFATFASRELLRDFPEVDSICRQEAEETLVTLVRAIERGRELSGIAGIAYREGEQILVSEPGSLPELATLPRPDRRGEPARCFGHGIAPLVGSRGCYANCSFCCIAAWHEQSLPGKRYRVREPDDVAREMVEMAKERGVDIFVFHDDNFFLPGHRKNRERITALADALERHGMPPFATVVKARPTDVDPEVFRLLRDRLQCIRVYVGVESDADQGLETLRRWAHSHQNHHALSIVEELGLYTCFNLLIFDPDTTLDSLRTNVAFLRRAAEHGSNFGRVELYAGTPLLARMQAEGRVRGDYLQWDYSLQSPEVERAFSLTMRCFHERNFGPQAANNLLMATRFDVEVLRHFHPDLFEPAWLAQGKALTRRISLDSVSALTAILDHVEKNAPVSEDDALVNDLIERLRVVERETLLAARELAATLQRSSGQGAPLTYIGDRVATPLQTQRSAALGG